MIIHKCDKCGVMEPQKKGESESCPAGWYRLIFKMGYGYASTVYYEVCPKCKIVLGIPDKEAEQTVGENLIDILSGIVEEIVDDKISNG
jgi:hypothetical protein